MCKSEAVNDKRKTQIQTTPRATSQRVTEAAFTYFLMSPHQGHLGIR